ncbi:hypothetical protein ARTHRO9AX_210188 [Arthrobacter sp. 9AX]|nr:hypothetical protein ARTHRO9AX_210188 [Arthrobacter sp. 9AX]
MTVPQSRCHEGAKPPKPHYKSNGFVMRKVPRYFSKHTYHTCAQGAELMFYGVDRQVTAGT